MNLNKTDSSFSPGYSSPEFYYQRSVDSNNKLDTDNKILKGNISPEIYISAETTGINFRVPTMFNHNLNSAIGLVQSLVSAAIVIEDKLRDIKSLARESDGATSLTIRKIEDSIISIANDFEWNGIRYMKGQAEHNQTTPLRKLTIGTGVDTASNLSMSFKSFNPTSAVKTDRGSALENLKPMNIDNLHATNTHAYGSAVLHSTLSNSSLLHTHTVEMRDQTILQINAAIDGVKREKARLKGYLTQLSDISNPDPSKLIKKSIYTDQTMDVERAYKIAIFIENKLPKFSDENIFPSEKINESAINELLH